MMSVFSASIPNTSFASSSLEIQRLTTLQKLRVVILRFNDAIENRCRQFLIEHKIKTLNEDLKLRYDRKKIFQLRLGEVFDVESEWFEKMWELVEKYQTGDFIKKEGWHNHHIIPVDDPPKIAGRYTCTLL